MIIRRATPDDAEALLDIYRPIVDHTTISFEVVPLTVDAFADRIQASTLKHEWLVIQTDDGVLGGYAYGTPYRSRAAYRYTVETSIYIAEHCRGLGIGKQLYAALFQRLDALGYHTAVAGITTPNPASEALHQSVGFERIGIFKEVGYKDDQWRDVSWWQRGISQS